MVANPISFTPVGWEVPRSSGREAVSTSGVAIWLETSRMKPRGDLRSAFSAGCSFWDFAGVEQCLTSFSIHLFIQGEVVEL